MPAVAVRVPLLLAAIAISLSAAGFTSEPVIEANPNKSAPLAAVVRFSVAEPVETTIAVSDGNRKWEVRFDSGRDPAKGLPLVGFRPARKHEIRVSIRDRAGKITPAARTLQFTAPPLPGGGIEFPPIRVNVSNPKRMEPGWTLLSVRRQGLGPAGGGRGAAAGGRPPGEPEFTTGYGLILALDEEGQVVWYHRSPNRTSDVHRLRNGNIAFLTNDNRLVEVDLLGNMKGEWCAANRPQGPCTGIPVDALTMHHSFLELPNGNFLVNSGELREIDNYYTSETDPNAPRKRRKVMGDVVLEFDRTGRTVWRWSAFDHLDVYRLGYLTVNQYWAVRGFPDTLDWTHGNGLFHDARDNSVLFNSRQQSSVFKIERPGGKLAWIFGEPGGWKRELQPLLFDKAAVSRWPWHHHAPRLTASGTLMVFNNGILKARPFQPADRESPVVSGALEYSLDAGNRTAALVWASDSPGQAGTVNSFAMGDVSPLPKTGNVLVVYGSAVSNETGRPRTRVREFRHTTPPQLVYDVALADEGAKPPSIAWVAFGGGRVPRFQ